MLDTKFDMPKSKQEAVKRGSSFFYTNIPCKRGHLSVRYTNSSKCKSCVKLLRDKSRSEYVISDTRQRIEKLKEAPDFEESWD